MSPPAVLNAIGAPLHRLMIAVTLLLAVHGEGAQVQTLRLDPGWNMIAFQVVPTNPAPASVFGSLGNAFERGFAYNNTAKSWTSYQRPSAAEANSIVPMDPITVGQAYWVYMNQAVPAWQVTGEPAAITPAVDFSQGWNLIGLPTGAGQLDEPLNMLSVLAAAGFDYDAILKWEQGLFGKFTPSDGDVDDFTVFDPNRGYWVNVKSGSFSLQPKLLCSVRPDEDVEPIGNYPGPEDLRLSSSPTPLSPDNQTHIVFLPGEDTQQIAIANTGGGILLWEIASTDAPWLRISATRGVTTIENDVINLYPDRRYTPPGSYAANLTLHTTAGDRSFIVVAHVPGLAGDWRGRATIATANGRRNPLPDIDLHLSFFEDAITPQLLRGLIDSRNALLWPVDVSLIGHSGEGAGNEFELSGGYVLPPGDVNNAPFGAFDGTLEDIDWNCDGKLDAVNPFPFSIYRSVTLLGALTEGTSVDGYRIQGEYSETIFGMLREPIHLRGTFDLRRDSLQPFASRRPTPNEEAAAGISPVVLKTFQPATPLNLRAGRTTQALNVGTDLALESVTVALDIGDAPALGLKVSLVGPSGQTVVLLDHPNMSSLHGLSFPNNRRPQESLNAFASSGRSTRGLWTLAVENSGPVTGHLLSWSLRLSGQPVFSVTGRVVDTMGNPLPGQVFLDGLPIVEVASADANGRFDFARLPGIPMNFSANLAGYESARPGLPGLGDLFTTPHYDATCASPAKLAAIRQLRALPVAPVPAAASDGFGANSGTAANPYVLTLAPRTDAPNQALALAAAPEIGFAPLEVQLSLTPGGALGGPLGWNFGDGTPPDTTAAQVRNHTYSSLSATGFVATLAYSVEGAPITLSRRILPMPSPGHSPYAANFFQVHYTGGGSYPAGLAANITGINDITKPAAPASLLQVQHAYCASFDIDLAPKVSGPGKRFDSDGFDPLNTIVNPANRLGNFRDEDYNYQAPLGNELGQWSLAADCGFAVADDTWSPHPRPGQAGDCALPRFQMLCNLGGSGMFIMPSTVAEVYPVAPGSPPVFASEPDPTQATGADGLARSRQIHLITGPLASFWKP
ncbi:MAG: proprotein convertase P-domain-containing protein [Verrucomicrobia bacterium]|nr:proprotein convertase P-domain-containing protein [Verrucomicrobiota bacterium]